MSAPSPPAPPPQASFHVAVVGLGAMGGGMARALLEHPASRTVAGFDAAEHPRRSFWDEAFKAGKCLPLSHSRGPPSTLKDAVDPAFTHVAVVVVQNEAQCEQVCFGGPDGGDDGASGGGGGSCLVELLHPGACVVMCSTVTPAWVRRASERFRRRGIFLVDAPVSGGPARARSGELAVMASATGDDDDDKVGDASAAVSPPTFYEALARPVLEALARPERGRLHWISGGAGMGSTVKLVHQLLAGVHIAAAAEALALAASAGLDTHQVLDVVLGAAGSSWMLGDRGPRMVASERPPAVKSALDIFVKDLDICYQEAKRLQAPIPLASAALQQFIAGQRLGLGRDDDSQVVRVYETITGVSVAQPATSKTTGHSLGDAASVDGSRVGDVWHLDDGTSEIILEVAQEPRHHVVLHNEYVRAIRVEFPPGDTTLAHRHDEDSLYFFFASLPVTNYVQGTGMLDDALEFGEIRYGTHKTDQPLIHKITNRSVDIPMLCVDAEVLRQPPLVAPTPLEAAFHQLVKVRPKCRVYRLELAPGESVAVAYPFFHLTVVLQPGRIRFDGPIGSGDCEWTQDLERAAVAWKEPSFEQLRMTNVGSTTLVQFIAEWC